MPHEYSVEDRALPPIVRFVTLHLSSALQLGYLEQLKRLR